MCCISFAFRSASQGAWISICLFLTIWLRRNLGLVEHSRDPTCSRPCVCPARKLVNHRYCQCSHNAPCTSSGLGSFSLAGFSFRCFESKMAHMVGVQESRCRDTSVRFFRGYTVLTTAATPLGQGSFELWVSSDVAKIKDFCLLHADPRRFMVTLPLHGCTSLATVRHAPDRHHGEDPISVWWQETLDLLKRLCPSEVPVIAMIDANAEVGSEVSSFIGNKDAAPGTSSGSLLHRFRAELPTTPPATHQEPTSRPDGSGTTWTHTTGNWRRIDLVALPLLGCRPVPIRTLGRTVNLPFKMERITGLLRWVFPFSSVVLVYVSAEISLPGEHSSSQMLHSAQKPSGGLCLAGLSTGTSTGWKLLLPSWLASFSQPWLRLKRGAQLRTGSRQILGWLLSSTEVVNITSL